MLQTPALVYFVGLRFACLAVEQHDTVGIAIGFKKLTQKSLRLCWLGEDKSFPLCPLFLKFGKRFFQSDEQSLWFWFSFNGFCFFNEALYGFDFLFQTRNIYLIIVEQLVFAIFCISSLVFVRVPFVIIHKDIYVNTLLLLAFEHSLETFLDMSEGIDECVGRRSKYLTHNHSSELLLRGRNTVYVVSTQEVAYSLIQLLLLISSIKLLCEWKTMGIIDILLHVATQGASI